MSKELSDIIGGVVEWVEWAISNKVNFETFELGIEYLKIWGLITQEGHNKVASI